MDLADSFSTYYLSDTFGIIELCAVASALIYVLLAAKKNVLCWPFGIISSAIYIYLFLHAKLYAESFLYAFYVAAGVYGWVLWSVKEAENGGITIWKFRQHVKVIFFGVLAIIPCYYLLSSFTDAALPFFDSTTTVFSLIATYLVAKKELYNWIYWILIDSVSVALYYMRDLELSAFLMIIYSILAIWGFFSWRKYYRLQ